MIKAKAHTKLSSARQELEAFVDGVPFRSWFLTLKKDRKIGKCSRSRCQLSKRTFMDTWFGVSRDEVMLAGIALYGLRYLLGSSGLLSYLQLVYSEQGVSQVNFLSGFLLITCLSYHSSGQSLCYQYLTCIRENFFQQQSQQSLCSPSQDGITI